MQDIRPSTREREEKRISDKEQLLVDAFIASGYKLDETFTEETRFIKEISSDCNHFLWQVLSNCYYNLTMESMSQISFQQLGLVNQIDGQTFVNECMHALKRFHIEITEMEMNIKMNEEKLQLLPKLLNNMQKQDEFITKENILVVSYVKDKVYKTGLFEHYRMKYKLGGTYDEQGQRIYHSIYSVDEQRSCIVPIDMDQDNIELFFFGKLMEDEDEDFKIISTITMPLEEILTTLNYMDLNQEVIKPIYLVLQYTDDTVNSPYTHPNDSEFKFDLRLSKSERIKLIKRLEQHHQQMFDGLTQSTEKKVQLIQDILKPFDQHVEYIKGQGISPRQKNRIACEKCCIF